MGLIIGLFVFLFQLAIAVVVLAGVWKTYEKMGKPGWAGIVPIYNLYVLTEVLEKPITWFILMLIPFVGIVFWTLACIELAKKFGKGPGFGVGLALLGFIFFPILGFSDATFEGKREG